MTYNPEIHHRRSIRLKGCDYSQAGLYFVTICTKNWIHLFGEIINGVMDLNAAGETVSNCWYDLPNHYQNIELDVFVVMPNHIHGIIRLVDVVGAGFKPAPTPPTKHHGLSEIVRALKTFSARRINEIRKETGVSVWQRNYYEHIIRDEKDYHRIATYIQNNPLKWQDDKYYD